MLCHLFLLSVGAEEVENCETKKVIMKILEILQDLSAAHFEPENDG